MSYGVEVDIDSEPGGEMDMPAEEPEMEMDAEMEMDEEHGMSESYSFHFQKKKSFKKLQSVLRKRINEAARAQKKADKLLGRNKK